ncbi:hypothetical protein ACIG87_25905 [Micromonospora sp. NPDC051925]|uniref:hypothetical protein n=1 Tax=Micromonospora sp. NPDC051925 TaxID=3364288 RepID=UPI0037CA8ED1
MTDEQIVLLGGLWLDASAWDGVVSELARRGRRAVAVSLPGRSAAAAASLRWAKAQPCRAD